MDGERQGESVDRARRMLCGSAAAAFAMCNAEELASSSAQMSRPRVSSPAAGFPSLKHVNAGVLRVAFAEMGPPGGRPVILLHGWPYDIHSFAEATHLLAASGFRVIVPFLRGYGPTQFLNANALRNGQPAALATDLVDLMDALEIRRATIAGFDWGARTAGIAAALWPERVAGLVAVSGYLISAQEAGGQPLPPEAEFQWWYQFYFATERGRLGYERNRREFARLIWKLASPKWSFDDQTFDRSAVAFDNADHVAVVIHNYRWRLGIATGEMRYDDLERRLAERPVITVPTITLEGDANGAPHPAPSTYAGKFTSRYEHREIGGGIGHNLPQEAPAAFAKAVTDVALDWTRSAPAAPNETSLSNVKAVTPQPQSLARS